MALFRISSILSSSLTILLSLFAMACGNGSKTRTDNSSAFSGLSIPELTTTTLQARQIVGQNDNYSEAAFSFYHLSHDQNITHNDYDIIYQGSMLQTRMVVDHIGAIADLGAISCRNVQNHYEGEGTSTQGNGGYPSREDRQRQPMFWLEYSEAMHVLDHGPLRSTVVPQQGHCYIINHISDRKRVIAFFHVRELRPGQSITIDEIEVFGRWDLTTPHIR